MYHIGPPMAAVCPEWLMGFSQNIIQTWVYQTLGLGQQSVKWRLDSKLIHAWRSPCQVSSGPLILFEITSELTKIHKKIFEVEFFIGFLSPFLFQISSEKGFYFREITKIVCRYEWVKLYICGAQNNLTFSLMSVIRAIFSNFSMNKCWSDPYHQLLFKYFMN